MNTNIKVLIGAIAIAVIGVGLYASMKTTDDAMMDKKTVDSSVMQEENVAPMKETSETMMKETSESMMKAGSYEAYVPSRLAQAETGDVVLFFHASWCPSCRGLNSDIESNLTSIPEGVVILKVDYDKEVELKKKYGVTYQHTLVQVDKDGDLIKKWSGSPKLANLVSQIQ